ncbi:MAG: GHKL domain-containing protein [Oscillospiraceae bacterium]|nr:GHKL domain-containing protein [Oscillospiraceae bacterium]
MYNAVLVLLQLFSVLYVRNFLQVFLGQSERGRLFRLLTDLPFIVFPLAANLFVNIPLVNFSAHILGIAVISLQYRARLRQRIAGIVFISILTLVLETVVAVFTNYFGISSMERGTYENIGGNVASVILTYAVSQLMKNVKAVRQKQAVQGSEWFALVAVPVISMFLLFVLNASPTITKANAMLLLLSILLINALIFYLYEKLGAVYQERLESAVFEQEVAYYRSQCDYMAQASGDMAAFRHDYRNHLLTLQGFLEDGQNEEGIRYIRELSGEEGRGRAQLCDTGNLAVDGIVNFKLSEAVTQRIRVEAGLRIPKDLALRAADITVILGNLIDNAIHAAVQLPEEERFLHLRMEYDKGRLFLQVENPAAGEICIRDGQFLGKQHTPGHGYGLANVRRALERYHGELLFSERDRTVTATCMLYLHDTQEDCRT